MLGQVASINGAVQGLGVLVGQQRPFVGFLLKNWPLAAIAGFAMFARTKERHKKGELSTYNALADLGLVLSPLVGLALLNQLAQQEQWMRANAGAPMPVPPPGAPS